LLIAASNAVTVSGSAANFSNATVVTGGTFNGNIITFTGIDLEDGQYFTLGTDFETCAPGGVETDLALWLRADVGTNTIVNGADITSWEDQSLNGYDASETNAGGTPVEPTYTQVGTNFNPAIAFTDQGSTNTTNSWLTTSTNPATDDMTLIAVFATTQSDATGLNATFDSPAFLSNEDGGGGNLYALGHSGGRVHSSLIAGTGFGARSTSTYNDGVPHMALSTRVQSTAAGSIQLYLDGASDGSAASDLNSLNKNNGIGIGNHLRDDFNFWDGQFDGTISEAIVFSDDLTSDEKNRVETYLAIKYGITKNAADDGATGSVDERDYRDSEGTVIWDHTDQSSGYNSDIAGIGRDDAQCFEQKQSSSVNSDGLVTMGLGGIESSNAANSNSFTADNSFLVWGNDNDATAQASANTSDVPGIITERMERIWHVQETGTVGGTTISFDLTGLGYTGTSASDFNLITSSSATMASGTITPAASFASNVVTFTGVDFSDGDFFTLGTARSTCSPGGVNPSSNLNVWLRADIESFNTGVVQATDGQTVATWSDQSGNSNDGTTDGNPPVYHNNVTDNINFNPILEFDGTNDRLETQLDGIKGTNYTVLAVGERADANNSNYVLGGERNSPSTNEVLHFGYRTNTAATLAQFGNDIDVTVSAFDASSAPFLLFGELDGSGRVIEETRNNGFARNTDTNTSQLIGTVQDYVANFGATYYGGKISEIVAISSDITDLEKQQVTSYLAIKYGITLTSDNDNDTNTGETISGSVTEGDYVSSDGTTIVWDFSANSTYHNDVAGIGRDDASCFSQKQSTADGTDDILTVGLGSVATDNMSNANTFTDDRDYLVWGNDNGATAEASKNTVDVPNSVSERMTRIWKVQDTGTVGETELQFDLTGLGYSVADATAFSLLVNNSATMNTATVISGGTLNGNVLSFTGVDLTDGQFFTIGTGITICGPGGVNTNIAMWVKADAEVFSDNPGTTAATDGANALFWNDQGAQGHNMEEADLGGGANAIEPTFQTSEINFNPVVNFTDPGSTNNSYFRTDDSFMVPTNTNQIDFTLISVFKTGQASGTANDNVNSPVLISSRSGSGLDNAMGMDNGTIWVNADSDAAFEAETSNTYNNNIPHIATGVRDDDPGDLTIYVDAAESATATGITTNLDNADGGFGIGNHFTTDVDAQYAGDIAETIVYNQVLDSDQRNRVESYLAIKYGITLNGADDGTTGAVDERDYRAGDGGVVWDFSDKTTYTNDIFGIGRDDLSCLNQTQSKSENSDAIVTINNTGGFNTDDSWLVSGNDNAALEATNNTERPATINSRLNREWQVQETGTVGTVELTFDLSNVTGTASGSNNLTQTRLMVDDDGNFGNGGTTLISPSATNGGSQTVTFQVNFTDGQYYTLGSIENDALPITLISFEVNNYKDDQVKLDWVTASEVNNAFYTIERSTDGLNFEAIANLDGAGNSSDLLYYSFVDANPISGTSFYRLKQTDFSGEFDYSEIRSVRVEKQFEASFSAYPNPVVKGEYLEVAYTVEFTQDLDITVLNNTGQIMLRKTEHVNPSGKFFRISTNEMNKGLNLIRILDANSRTKILKILVK